MKITIVMGAFLPMPPAGFGAVERVWHGLAKWFVRRGHQVTLVCKAGPGEADQESLEGMTLYRLKGFARTNRLGSDLAKDLLYSVRCLKLLPKADILVTNTFWLPALAPRLVPSAGRVVVHVARAPKKQYWLYRGAARFDAVSNFIRDRIVSDHPELAPKVRTFPNPIDLDVLSCERSGRREAKAATIVYVGRLHPEKGVHLLVESFRVVTEKIPTARLRLIGPWAAAQGGAGPEYLNSLKGLAKGLAVEFAGPVSDQRTIAEALWSSNVFCYPSLAERGEALPLAPLEAMATGLVPVVSALKQFMDYIQPGVNAVTFDHRSSAASDNLARALIGLLLDRDRLARLSKSATARAHEFGYEHVGEMRLRDYEELLREQRG